jgi:hypothetical protein
MSAGLAKLFDKAFVLGYALPALVFFSVAVALFGCPAALCDTAQRNANPFADLTYAAIGVYLLGVVLLAINYGLYRLFEGYLPPAAWLGFAKRFHQRRLEQRTVEIDELGEDPRVAALTWQLRMQYPQRAADVLPTAFGNAIRAFELYPAAMYGADSISVWPRLLSVVSKDVQTLINDAKALVDLCVNLCALSLAWFVFAAGAALLERGAVALPFGAPHAGGTWSVVALVALLAAVASYRCALACVPDWGDTVKSAFDCYLPELARQLGYTMPAEPEGRREIWEALSPAVPVRRPRLIVVEQLVFGRPVRAARVDPAPEPRFVSLLAGLEVRAPAERIGEVRL